MKRTLALSSIALIAFTLISKVIGMARDMAMAYYFGASSLSDAYITAVAILTMLSAAALASLVVSYIPIISGKDDRQVSAITSNFMSVLSYGTLCVSLVAIFFTRQLVYLFASGFQEDTIKQTSLILKISLPFMFFTVILNLSIGYLQHKNQFWYQGFSAVLSSILILVSIVVSRKNLEVLAVGYAASMVLPAVLGLLLAQKNGLSFHPAFRLKDAHLHELIRISIPIFVSQLLIQINIIVDKNFSSSIGSGIMTDLDYAYRISILLISVFITSIATVLFPTLSRQAVEADRSAFKSTLRKGINITTLLTVPMMVGTIVLAHELIELALMRGNFNQIAANITAQSLIMYSLCVPAQGYIYILNNAFFSMKDTKTPVFCGAFSIILNILLNCILVRILSYRGLALATSISVILNVTLYFFFMRKRIGSYGLKNIGGLFLKTLAAALLMGAILWLLKVPISTTFGTAMGGRLCSLCLLVFLGVIAYFGLCMLFRISLLNEVWDDLVKKISKAFSHRNSL